MTKRVQIINSLCDLHGYSPDDFEHDTTREIIGDLTAQEVEELNEYSGLSVMNDYTK